MPRRGEFEKWLMLFYTGSSRISSEFAKKLISNLEANAAHMHRMREMVEVAVEMLHAGRLADFGQLLHESWTLKRRLADGTSTTTIDRIYDDARRAGALGGKLLGAGGTGFMVFVVPPDRQPAVREALSHLITVPVSADFTGSTIVYRKEELLGMAEAERATGHIRRCAKARRKGVAEMEVFATKLESVLLIKPPTVFEDFRGHYIETYNRNAYFTAGIPIDFIQDDISISHRHVLRGIHGDTKTWKLISCLQGSFYMVVVNNDPNSSQYREWVSFTLSDTNHLQVLVPPNFGNGHLVMSERAIFHYKQSTEYDRAGQFTLLWNDPTLNIWWPIQNPIVSQRDQGNRQARTRPSSVAPAIRICRRDFQADSSAGLVANWLSSSIAQARWYRVLAGMNLLRQAPSWSSRSCQPPAGSAVRKWSRSKTANRVAFVSDWARPNRASTRLALIASAIGQTRRDGAWWEPSTSSCVNDQSGVVKSISIGEAVQRIDIGLHRTAADLLVAPQQPDPFVVVSGLDKAAGDAIGRLEVGGEVLAQDAGIGSEEARGKQAEQLAGPRQVACITGAFPKRKQTLEQMHVRVLAAKTVGGREALPRSHRRPARGDRGR